VSLNHRLLAELGFRPFRSSQAEATPQFRGGTQFGHGSTEFDGIHRGNQYAIVSAPADVWHPGPQVTSYQWFPARHGLDQNQSECLIRRDRREQENIARVEEGREVCIGNISPEADAFADSETLRERAEFLFERACAHEPEDRSRNRGQGFDGESLALVSNESANVQEDGGIAGISPKLRRTGEEGGGWLEP
jgi:hypothetical protein